MRETQHVLLNILDQKKTALNNYFVYSLYMFTILFTRQQFELDVGVFRFFRYR